MPINWLTVGSLYGAAGVAFGAFGAHGLKSRGISDAKITSWGTASHYQVSSKKRQEHGSGKKGQPQNIHLLLSPTIGNIPTEKQEISPSWRRMHQPINKGKQIIKPPNTTPLAEKESRKSPKASQLTSNPDHALRRPDRRRNRLPRLPKSLD